MATDFNGANSGKPPHIRHRRTRTVGGGTPAEAQASKPAPDSTVRLTGVAARLKQLEASLADLPIVDKRRVEAIQRALADGTYEVDAEEIAEKLIEFEQQLRSRR